jgi:hypothetical protein
MSWQQTAGADENEQNAAEPAANDKKEREKKKRKLMKGLKKWTGLADAGERKFKGWSDNGHEAFEQWTVGVKSNVGSGKHALWEKAFQEAHVDQQDARRIEDEGAKKLAVNRGAVWELQKHAVSEMCCLKSNLPFMWWHGATAGCNK